jgi:hypothetical protein
MLKRSRYLFLLVVCLLTLTGSIALEPWINPFQLSHATEIALTQTEQAVQRTALKSLNSGMRVPATLRKLVVVDNFALAGWLRGEAGGQILLKRQEGYWKVITYGGGSLGMRGLTGYGVPKVTAEKILDQYDPNWRSYEP